MAGQGTPAPAVPRRVGVFAFGELLPQGDSMSLYPCSSCGERVAGIKYSNCTWAWFTAANERVAWRQKLCLDCYVRNVAVLATSLEESPFECPACHTDAGDDVDPTYLTAFLPGVGQQRLEMATCGPCAAEVRIRAQVGARKLEDRLAAVSLGAADRPLNDDNPWAALGITPRE